VLSNKTRKTKTKKVSPYVSYVIHKIQQSQWWRR